MYKQPEKKWFGGWGWLRGKARLAGHASDWRSLDLSLSVWYNGASDRLARAWICSLAACLWLLSVTWSLVELGLRAMVLGTGQGAHCLGDSIHWLIFTDAGSYKDAWGVLEAFHPAWPAALKQEAEGILEPNTPLAHTLFSQGHSPVVAARHLARCRQDPGREEGWGWV